MSGTGKIVVSDGYLADFAKNKLPGFVQSLTGDSTILDLDNYAAGVAAGASGAQDPSATYHTLLSGNPASGLNSTASVETTFKAMAGAMKDQITNLVNNAGLMSADLLRIDDVLNDSNDAAGITAAEMTADLQNINFGSGVPGGLPGTGGAGGGSTAGAPPSSSAPPSAGAQPAGGSTST